MLSLLQFIVAEHPVRLLGANHHVADSARLYFVDCNPFSFYPARCVVPSEWRRVGIPNGQWKSELCAAKVGRPAGSNHALKQFAYLSE